MTERRSKPTPTPTPTPEDEAKSLYNSRVKRYRYLLGQTDLFAHFLDLKADKDEALQKVLEERHHGSKAEDGSRRRRKTEKEEDEEILKDESGESDEQLTVFTESPAYVTGGTLRDYQVQGLNWMVSLYENGINGILADEMGLGKTLQTISFLGFLKHIRGINGPHLVVVPKSTLNNWKNEFSKWVPDFNAFIFHGDKEQRAKLIQERLKPMDFEVCITSYEICLLEKAQFKKISWQYIIIDEAHRIKNENSMLSQIVRILQSKNRMLITGTPLQNNLHELWALLNFLLPDVFNSSEAFDEWFTGQGSDQKKVVEQLHKVLRPFLLRRLKSDVEKSLLPKKETNVYVKMSPMQRKWYQKILEKDIDAINGGSGLSKREGKTRLLNIVMQLRKCCNHPYLFDGAEPGPPYTTDQHIVDNAGKMVVLDRLLTRLKAQGSRVLLFSQMSRVLDILEDYCWWRKFEYCRIDGQTSQDDRIDAIDEYNKPGSDKFIFLLTTRAGGLGINLTTADIVVLFDSDWNPQVDLQAMDRAHRIGQTKQVKVFRFVTENAIEEKVLERAAQKLRLDQLVIQQGRMQQSQKAASKDELLTMIQHGAEKIFNEADSSTPAPEDEVDDIEEIIRRGEEKTAELNKKYQNLNMDELRNFTSESAYQWNGEDWSNKRKAAGVGLSWLGPAKRERKGNYAVDDYYKEVLRINHKTPSTKAPRAKRYACEDFQFFPARLAEINEKDTLYLRKSLGYKIPPVSDEGEPEEIEQLEKERQEEQRKIDAAEALTEEEEEERKELYTKGFSNWSKKDFMTFVNACARYGRKNVQAIASDLGEGKTLDDIKKYSKVFWSRYKEIADYERHITKIERGESELEKMADIQEQLTEKVSRHRVPLQQLKIHYTQPTKGKNYTEEEDRFLLVMLEKYGYGTENVYDNIRREIKESPMFRFDWFLKSRTSQEIARRCNTLIGLIQKENAEFDDGSQKKGGSKAGTPTPKSRRR
ncbi:SNF2 family N-terminal domain-containing protein [Phascolomyces articulosus]|uniref:SNF2 family N-terminal domain-containing protein n=1 Tax=Phascolomyces articulosus TaxID=60185 RepID=A0AAD5JND7_9FUNG|nr:SNF2 family N-terminal domain-containing protein [Phascolomyces articulosus]